MYLVEADRETLCFGIGGRQERFCVAEVNWKMGILAREMDRGTV